jgi:hypothetical protein
MNIDVVDNGYDPGTKENKAGHGALALLRATHRNALLVADVPSMIDGILHRAG